MARFEKGDKIFEITSNDGRYTTELRKHLREGWTRVADPRIEVPLGAEPHNATFEDALRADPDDIGAALVYADWLQQQGHPRGALIAVQHRLASNPRDASLVEEERRIIEDARDALLSKAILAHLAILRRNADGKSVEIAPSRNFYAGGTVTFDHGFIREALVVIKQRAADEDALWELLRHPSARVLARLGVIVDLTRDAVLVVALLARGPRPPLRFLSFRVDHRYVIDLSGLDEAYPLLEELEVSIHNARFGSLELPHLRRLGVGSLFSDIGVQLAAYAWPSLEMLSVYAHPKLLDVAFAKASFPSLRTLVLWDPGARDALVGLETCRMVTRSPVARQLQRLELQNVQLAHEAINYLVENRARFENLTVLRASARKNELDRLRDAGYPVLDSPAD